MLATFVAINWCSLFGRTCNLPGVAFASYGITPSNKTQYALKDITNVLVQQTSAVPYLGCTHNGTVLSEVWYFNHVFGTEQYGRFKAVDPTTNSSCSSTLPIWYYERTKHSEREVRFEL